MVTSSCVCQDFLAFTAHVRSLLGSPIFSLLGGGFKFLSLTKADQVNFFPSLTKHVQGVYKRTFPLWEFVKELSLFHLLLQRKLQNSTNWFNLLCKKGATCKY